MRFYSREWYINVSSKHINSIEDYIRIYEERVKLLKKWKEKGIYLDPNSKNKGFCVTFYTTDLKVANEENFTLDESKSEIQYRTYKIGIHSQHKLIKDLFYKGIHATGHFRENRRLLSYKVQQNHYTFQFHSLQYSAFDFDVFLMSMKHKNFQGIIHFYHINDKIERYIIPFLKNDSRYPVPILFVGYDSILPQNPEDLDQNIPIIKETTKISGSCYISIDDPNSMFQIIDKLIELIF